MTTHGKEKEGMRHVMVAPRSDLHDCVLASHNGSNQWHNLDLASYDDMQLASQF